MFETASSKVSDHLFSVSHLPKAQIPWKRELMLKWMLLHNPAAALPTHTHRRTRHACTCKYLNSSSHTYINTHMQTVCGSCSCMSSGVELCGEDLWSRPSSQPASPICMYSPGSVGFLAPHQLQMQVTKVARGRFPHIPACESVCVSVCDLCACNKPVLLQARNIAVLCVCKRKRGNEEKGQARVPGPASKYSKPDIEKEWVRDREKAKQRGEGNKLRIQRERKRENKIRTEGESGQIVWEEGESEWGLSRRSVSFWISASFVPQHIP